MDRKSAFRSKADVSACGAERPLGPIVGTRTWRCKVRTVHEAARDGVPNGRVSWYYRRRRLKTGAKQAIGPGPSMDRFFSHPILKSISVTATAVSLYVTPTSALSLSHSDLLHRSAFARPVEYRRCENNHRLAICFTVHSASTEKEDIRRRDGAEIRDDNRFRHARINSGMHYPDLWR